MRLVLLFGLYMTWFQDAAMASVRITELRVEAHIAEGASTMLGCKFNMEDDTLYALKWFKDGREFYRYVPKAEPPTKIFHVPGVKVDLSRSSTNFVTLKQFTRESAGVYRCEVYGEGPNFTVVHREKHVAVDLLPKTAPRIVGLEKEYRHGSRMDVNCTTDPSRPEAQLAWFINDTPAPKDYLRGPMLVIPTNHPYSYQAKLNLHFTVYESHFLHGVLTIKCQATIPPLYHNETKVSFYDQSLLTTSSSPADTAENISDHATTTLVTSFFCFTALVLFSLIV